MRLFVPILAAAAVACGDSGRVTSSDDPSLAGLPSGPGALTVSPLDTATIMAISPLGMLSPPGHVLPTDHIYISFVDPWGPNQQANDCSARPVRAAGAGRVSFILKTEAAGDTKVMVRMTRTFQYYYDHVILDAAITVGTEVKAGQVIGSTTGRCPSIDLGVLDADVTLGGWVNRNRYGGDGLTPAAPLRYFTEPLRTALYARVRMMEGIPADRDGRIDWGVKGRLAGDWFHATLSAAPASVVMGPDGWPRSLSFAYDWFDHAQRRISIGGVLTTPGVLAVPAADPDFAGVSTASGLVVYRTTRHAGLISDGWLLVQMLADDRIKVEYQAGAVARPTAFTSAAIEYVR